MDHFIDPCCSECFNSKEKPCDVFIECCLQGPLCHESESCKEARKAIVKRYSHSPLFREQ
ncbi:MAG: CCxxC motif-containing NuoF prefix domain-containing protein [Bacillota bacterium]|nr:CCxxC motif-containing NuoF prefix domain-containing protein [Bacillota bacterium]